MHLRRKCILLRLDGMSVSGVAKSPTVIVSLLISPFMLLALALFMEVLLCGCMCIYIFNCCICFFDGSIDHYVVSFLVPYNSI